MNKLLLKAVPLLGLVVDLLLIIQLTVTLCGHFCRPKTEANHSEDNIQ